MVFIQDFTLPFQIVAVIFIGMFGAILASFFTCMGERIAVGKDWVKERSVCDSCGHTLGILDLVPIFSYIWNKGECRYCHKKIPKICIITEVCMALYAIATFLRFGISILALRNLLFVGSLLAMSIVDMKTYEIPDGFHIFGIILWAITLPFIGGNWKQGIISSLIGGFVVGGGMLILSLIMDKILKKDSLGGGDIKLFFVIGLYLKLGTSLFNLIISCLVGLIFVFVLKKDKIPFGPSISIATAFSLLYGAQLVAMYLGLLG